MGIPLVRALASLRTTRPRGTVAIYAVFAVAFLVVSSVPVCGRVQDQLARAHHARPSSTLAWAGFQLVPKMYSFGHRIWLSPEPLTDAMLASRRSVWINHYPARVTRFETARAATIEQGTDFHVYIRSAYQGRRWVSRFTVSARDGGFVITPLPVWP